MRKLIVCNIMSLDGYVEGPGKDIMALFEYRGDAYPLDESFDAYTLERLRAAGTLLLGRTAFEGFLASWPTAADNPEAGVVEREIAKLNASLEKIVVSDSLRPEDTDPWNNTVIIGRAEARGRTAELKSADGKDILVFGSRTLWNGLLAAGLADEIHFIICPVAAGAGTPAFDGRNSFALGGQRWTFHGIYHSLTPTTPSGSGCHKKAALSAGGFRVFGSPC